jgi:hypothetical protein
MIDATALDQISKMAWFAVAARDLHWWVGTYGGDAHDTTLVRGEGAAIAAGGYVGITERSNTGWTAYLFDGATGHQSIQTSVQSSPLILATPGRPGQLFVADAGDGSSGTVLEFSSGAPGKEVVSASPKNEAGDLTVFNLSASGSTLLHSYCSEVACRATIVGTAGTVTLDSDLFPVATTDLSVLAFEDLDGRHVTVVDIVSGERTPLVDPDGSIQRPISRAIPLDDTTFLVDSGAELFAVDTRTGSVRRLLGLAARTGWDVSASPVGGRWLLLHRVKVDGGPVLTTDQLRSIGVLDLQTGLLSESIFTLPFAP